MASNKRLAQPTNNKTFEGSCPQLKGYYYTFNPDQPAVDEFQETTDKVIEFVCSTFKQSQPLKATIKHLAPQTITEPKLLYNGPRDETTKLKTSTEEDRVKYGIQFKNHEAECKELAESLSKTFAIIYGQCTRAMKAKIEEDPKWATIDSKCDPIELLKIIKAIAHNNESQKDPTLSLIQAEKRLMNMVQGDGQSNDSYRIKFENQANVICNMGGQLYRDATLDIVSTELYNKDFDKISDGDQQKQIREAASELWKARLFIINSNPGRFDQLKKEMHNNCIKGDKKSYPNTFNGAYNLLSQHKTYGSSTVGTSHGTSFTQNNERTSSTSSATNQRNDDDGKPKLKQAPKRFAEWKCGVCGKMGHPPSPNYCPLVQKLDSNPKLRDKLEASIQSDSESSKSDKSASTSHTKKKKKRTTDKKSSKQTRKDLVDEIKAEILATLKSHTSSGSESSDADESGDGYFQFLQIEPGSSATSPSTQKSRSARNSRSACTENTWTLVRKKPKKQKHSTTRAVHKGDTVILKHNQTGIERCFISTHRVKQHNFRSDNSVSSFETASH